MWLVWAEPEPCGLATDLSPARHVLYGAAQNFYKFLRLDICLIYFRSSRDDQQVSMEVTFYERQVLHTQHWAAGYAFQRRMKAVQFDV